MSVASHNHKTAARIGDNGQYSLVDTDKIGAQSPDCATKLTAGKVDSQSFGRRVEIVVFVDRDNVDRTSIFEQRHCVVHRACRIPAPIPADCNSIEINAAPMLE